MDAVEHAAAVRFARLELKQARLRPSGRTDDEQRELNARRWLTRVDGSPPRAARTDAERRSRPDRMRAYEADRTRRGGWAAGERLREAREATPGGGMAYGVNPQSATHSMLNRRANTRLTGPRVTTSIGRGGERTMFSNGSVRRPENQAPPGGNGVRSESTYTPSERLGNTVRDASGRAVLRNHGIGELSRSRRISPGMAPPARGEPGYAAYVRRFREGSADAAHRRRWGPLAGVVARRPVRD